MIKIEDKKQILHHVLYGMILILFLLEPFVKIFDEPSSNFRIKAILKLTLLVIIIAFAFIVKVKKDVFFFLIALILSFLIGQYMLTEKHSIFGSDLIEEIKRGDIYIAIKYLYIFFFVAVYEKITNNEYLTKRLIKLFNWFMIINTSFILIGLITKWELLKTYAYTSRFGYQGIIELAGESIHLYTIAISLAYINYTKTKKYFLLLFFLFGGVMLGKKAIFLHILLLGFVHLVYLKKKKILIGIGAMSLLMLIFSQYIIDMLLKIFPFWQSLYEAEGLVTVIFSKRDILFQHALTYIGENWSILNYMFGGVDFLNFRSEFGFFDLFLTFGIIGFAIYFLFIYRYFLSKQTRLVKAMLILIFITEAFSGGLVINIIPMILLYLAAKYLETNNTHTT